MLGRNAVATPARVATVAVSGGVLVLIWCGVWYAALATGRANPAAWKVRACQVGFAAGGLSAASGFAYLRSRKLSVLDGSKTQEVPALGPPPAPPPKSSPPRGD